MRAAYKAFSPPLTIASRRRSGFTQATTSFRQSSDPDVAPNSGDIYQRQPDDVGGMSLKG